MLRRYSTSVQCDAGGGEEADEPAAVWPQGPVPPPGQPLTAHVTRHGAVFRGGASPGGAGPSDGWQATAAGPPPQVPAPSPPPRAAKPPARYTKQDALPPILPDEGPAPGVARLQAHTHCWRVTADRFKAVLRDNHEAAFAAVTEVVSCSARRGGGGAHAGSDTPPVGGHQLRLPTALVLAGGVNQADHSETFAALAAHLADHGCCPALLRSQDVGPRSGGGTHPGLTATVRTVWNHLAQCVATQVAAGGAATPGGRSGAADDAATGAEAVPQWPTVTALCSWYCSRFAGRSPMSPLVILIEDTECCASDALADLVVALDECRGSAPVSLVLGVATSPSLVQALLPMRGASRLHPHIVRLRTSADRLECVQRDVLLGCGGGGSPVEGASHQPGPSAAPQHQRRAWLRTMPLPLLDADCAALLHTRFVEHDFSLTALRDTLQLAGLLHACTCPLAGVLHYVSTVHSADAEAAEMAMLGDGDGRGGGVSAKLPVKLAGEKAHTLFKELLLMLNSMPAPLRQWSVDKMPFLQGLAPRQQVKVLAAALRDFGPASCAWGAAVACVAAAAHATGTPANDGLAIRELFRDAADPGFATSSERVLTALLDRIADASAMPKYHLLSMLRQWAIAMQGCSLLTHLLDKTVAAATSLDELILKEKQANEELLRRQRRQQQQRQRQLQAAAVPHRNSGASLGGGIRALDTALGGGGASTPMPGGGGGSGSGPRRSSLGASGPGAAIAASGAKQSERNRKEMRAMLWQHAASKEADAAAAASGALQNQAPATEEGTNAQLLAARNDAREVLQELIKEFLAKPPASLPAAPVLVMSDSRLLRGYLQAAPRSSIEHALLGPGHADFLHCACCPTVLGKRARASMPDACAAYSLLQGLHAEFVNVHDWFQQFIQLHSGTPSGGTAGGGGGGGGASRPLAKKGKGKGKARGTQPLHPAARVSGGGDASLPSSKVSQQDLWNLQARFERALAELRLVGLIRPAKKRRGEYVQRLVFGADTQVGGDGDEEE